eukprot:32088_1
MSSEKLALLKLSKKELIKQCKRNKLSINGTKQDMVERILQCKKNKKVKQQPKNKISKTSTFDLSKCTLCIYKKHEYISSTLKCRTNLISQLSVHPNSVKNSAILLSSNTLINKDISIKLIELIKPLQNNLYNFRDEQFIKNQLNFQKTHWDYPTRKPPPKIKIDKRIRPKLQELINKFQHLHHNKRMLK